MDDQTIRLEVTEEYIIDEVGNATIYITYQFINEKDEPILNFSKKLVRVFDSTNIDILLKPKILTDRGSVRDIDIRVDRGRTLIQWIVKRDVLRRGDDLISPLVVKCYGLASRLGESYTMRISYLPPEQMGYTLIVQLPKLQLPWWKQLIYSFKFITNPPPDEAVDPRELVLKWKRPALSDKFDVEISYGFKIKIWSKIFSIMRDILRVIAWISGSAPSAT